MTNIEKIIQDARAQVNRWMKENHIASRFCFEMNLICVDYGDPADVIAVKNRVGEDGFISRAKFTELESKYPEGTTLLIKAK